MRGLKDKLAVVLNKTSNDDRLVSALRAENASPEKGNAPNGCGI